MRWPTSQTWSKSLGDWWIADRWGVLWCASAEEDEWSFLRQTTLLNAIKFTCRWIYWELKAVDTFTATRSWHRRSRIVTEDKIENQEGGKKSLNESDQEASRSAEKPEYSRTSTPIPLSELNKESEIWQLLLSHLPNQPVLPILKELDDQRVSGSTPRPSIKATSSAAKRNQRKGNQPTEETSKKCQKKLRNRQLKKTQDSRSKKSVPNQFVLQNSAVEDQWIYEVMV